MRKILFTATLALGLAGMNAQTSTPALKSAVDSASYALGQLVGMNMQGQIPGDLKPELIIQAIGSVLKSENQPFTPDAANEIFGAYNEKMVKAQSEKSKADGAKFLEDNKKRAGVVTTASGLQYEILKKGTGTVNPKATDNVKVHYHGTLINGSVFDSSVERNDPITFGLNQVIPGWTEGVQLMHAGDKFKFFIPADLAYGDNSPTPAIPGGSMLIFEVELLEINPQ
ncbi:MAG: FKBP-type peptidyl-prolyl cis-trans isomerase [Saprospiraceae bacterium]|nr:FKBP-type peptidyl-prolyl cis-trans isomerase [Saprospiraceae bacterium]